MIRRAIPARNSRASGRHPCVTAIFLEAASPSRVKRAALQSCIEPRLPANVLLAGEPCLESKLHRPRPARFMPWRATSLLFAAGTMPASRNSPANERDGKVSGPFPGEQSESQHGATRTSSTKLNQIIDPDGTYIHMGLPQKTCDTIAMAGNWPVKWALCAGETSMIATAVKIGLKGPPSSRRQGVRAAPRSARRRCPPLSRGQAAKI